MNNLNYGIIGNCRSAALVSDRGSIDWCCLPNFNSSSIFAALLDRNKGGHFAIECDPSYSVTQKYIRNTNILCTTFASPEGSFELLDFMPRYRNKGNGHYNPPDLIRYLRLVSGKPTFHVRYEPRLEYASYLTKSTIGSHYIKSFTTKGDYDSVYLYTNLEKKKVLSGDRILLTEDAYFLLSYNQKLLEQTTERSYLKLQRTIVYWLNWADETRKFSCYQEEIMRSALTLKLLSYDQSGAVLAAATTSLPETIGETRNWDYRFCWLRDASMVIKVMTGLGHMSLSRRFLDFIIRIIPDKDEKIQIMYGIDGERKLTEKVLGHLEGYEGSAPVRIGNAAYKQKQHDIYGILMEVIYQQFSIFDVSLEHSEALWTITRSIVKIVRKNWKKPDRGIWEIRTEQRHFTFSKVLCWVAIDRAIRIAEMLNMKQYIGNWSKLRNAIRDEILEKAWNPELEAFTQYYGSAEMDASTLLMEPYGFIEASDKRYISTVHVTEKLLMRDGLMYRYRNRDDFGLPTSSFTICTFWLINALARIGEKEKAKYMFNRLLSYSNHLGLFSEDIDFESKRLLGNFPQAYSHLALIETAVNLSGEDCAKSSDKEKPWIS